MSDIELRLTADVGQATKGIGGFRKEYAELVKAIEAPLRQIDALQKTQESAKKASAEFFAAKRRVDELKTAIAAAGQPVKSLDRDLASAERTLTRTTAAFDKQKAKVREQRAELKAAGVDYRSLAAEQQRLQGALGGAVGKGKADAAITQALDSFGVTKLRDLRAQLLALQSDYKRLTQAGVLSTTERVAAEARYQAALSQTRKQIAELTTQQAGNDGGGIAGITARLAGLTAAAYTVQRVAGFYFNAADAVGELEDRMRNALPTQAAYEQSQARLEEVSKRVRVPIAQTSELFLGAVGPLREMGYSAKTTADLVGSLSAGLVANSVKGQRAAAVIDQINKGLQTGVIRGDAFNAVIQNSPALTDALTKGLGVTRAELIRMANAGELTTEKFVTALAAQSEGLLALADAMRVTVGDAQGTFSGSLDKVIGSIDKLTGASAWAVKELDKLSAALDAAAKGDGRAGLDALTTFGVTTGMPAIQGLSALYKAYDAWRGDVVEAVDAVTVAEEKARAAVSAIQEQRLSEMRAYAGVFGEAQKGITNAFKTALDDQVAAQNKANSALTKAKNEQLATEKRYSEALEKLRAGATGPASYGNAQALQAAARNALAGGDVERAKRNAQEALKMLGELADAGENTYGFEGFIKSLQVIEQQADKAAVEKATKARQIEIDKVREFKKEFEELKDFKIAPSIDDAALAEATAKMQRWAKMIGKEFVVDPRVLSDGGTVQPEGWRPPMATVGQPQKPAMPPEPPVASAAIKSTGAAAIGWGDLPEVEVKPKWVRDGNSFSDAPVEVEAKPKWVRDGNSFTDAPLEVDVAVKSIAQSEDAPVEVKAEVDEASKVAVAQDFAAFVGELARNSVVPLRFSMSAPTPPDPNAPLPAMAAGGKLRGPGTGTSDSILMWGSNGEFMQPKSTVDYYGEGFMEALRQRRIPKFAEGGSISNRALPAIPAMNPALMQSANPLADWGRATLDSSAGSLEVLMRQDSFDRLLRRTAMKHGG